VRIDNRDIPYDVDVMDNLIEKRIHCKDCKIVKDILRLRFIKGMSFFQIERETGVSLSTVGRKIHKYGDPLLLELADQIGFFEKK